MPLLALLAACGGGGGVGSVASGPPPVFTTPAPTATPAPVLPASATATLTAGAAPASAAVGPVAPGIAASVGFPAAAGPGATLSVVLSSSPGTAPAVQGAARLPRSIGAAGIAAVTYVRVTPSADVTFASTPVLTFSASGGTPVTAPASGFVGFYDPAAAGGWTTLLGPVTIGGTATSWTFPAGASTTTLKAGTTYVYALFTAASAVATPSPVPTATPVATPLPTATPVATPLPTATPVPTATPAASLPAAPAVGLLASLATGGFGGTTASGTGSAMLVGFAPGRQSSSGAAVTTAGSVSVGVNGVGGASVRRAASRAAADGPVLPVEFQPLASRRLARAAMQATRHNLSGVRSTTAVRRLRSLPTTVGATSALWAQNAAIGATSGTYKQVPATLAAVTTHAYIWIDSSLGGVLGTPSTVAAIANDFENAWASDNAHFTNDAYDVAQYAPANACDAAGNVVGTTLPFVAHDARTVVFVVNPASLGGGVGGYFDEVNFFPQSYLQCFANIRSAGVQSNEAPMIYVGWFGPGGSSNPLTFTLQEDLVRGTAHEYQHLLNFVSHNVRTGSSNPEDAFINEGLSMLAQDLAVPHLFPQVTNDALDAVAHANQFADAPQNFSLTGFSGIDPRSSTPAYNCSGCYGASYVFQRYLYDRFGGDAYLAQAENGAAVGLAHLATVTGESSTALLGDFGLALAADNATSDPRYRIPGLPFGTSLTTQLGGTASVHAPAAVNAAATGSGIFAGPFDGGYVLVTVPGSGSAVTIKEKTGAVTFAAGIAQH